MSSIIRRELWILYWIIILYNIRLIHCQYWIENSADTIFDPLKAARVMAFPQDLWDGSGSEPSTMTSITTAYTTPSINCNVTSEVALSNGTCVLKNEGQKIAIDIIRDNSSNSSAKADALILYFSSTTNLTTESGIPDILSAREIDELVDGLDGSIFKNVNDLVVIAQPIIAGDDTVLGALMKLGQPVELVRNTTKTNVINLDISVGAILSDQSVKNIDNLRLFILGDPTAYRNLDTSNGQSVTSPVIIPSGGRKPNQSSINVSLYFQDLKIDNSRSDGQPLCAFFDTSTSRWNETGCTKPKYNKDHDRYECTCNHLTSFALIWLPNSITDYLDSQDIASLVFLSISILCFIAVITHSLTIRLLTPATSLRARDLLPLISSASTTILFIFYIALGMTVYTRVSSPSRKATPCFASASVLMFFVYFFLIFMFCVKTSVGYFNYIRFVCLFPEPSRRTLFIMLILSFFISIAWTLIAVGFNSNSTYSITQLHLNKVCWFNPNVIHYFMTIPVCIFLLLNFITIIFVGKHIVNHIRRSTSPHQSYERMKRCVLVLLSSCVTQGIGWLFGPIISFLNPEAGKVLGWFFIIFNGLEGLWTVLLYIIIRLQAKDELKQATASKQPIKKTSIETNKSVEKRTKNNLNSVLAKRYHSSHRKNQLAFDDLYDEESIDWETSSCEV